MAIKESEFVGTSVVGDAAFFTLFINGQNLKIPKADLIAALGMTGSIEQVGEVTGTPVLDVSGGAAKLIRNLVKGSGIKTSVSPLNGILLEHDFTFDTVSEAVIGVIISLNKL